MIDVVGAPTRLVEAAPDAPPRSVGEGLSAVGVRDEDIVDDYMLTGESRAARNAYRRVEGESPRAVTDQRRLVGRRPDPHGLSVQPPSRRRSHPDEAHVPPSTWIVSPVT